MFSCITLKEKNPVNFTGAIYYSLLWSTATPYTTSHANPHYEHTALSRLDPGTVIVCVHGTADRPSAFKLISERLASTLPSQISSMLLVAFEERFMGSSILVFSEQLIQILQHYNIKKAIFFSFSRGGLVAAHFAENHAAKANVEILGLYAICAPFHGTTLALPPLTWLSKSINEMQPGSDFLKTLNEKISVSKIPYYCFAAENDSIVTDPQSCKANAPVSEFQILDRHGHLSIMTSHRLVNHLRNSVTTLTQKNATLETEFKTVPPDENAQPLPESKEEISIFQATLIDAIFLTELQISELKLRHYFEIQAAKISVLGNLLTLLIELQKKGATEKYPEASTLGGLINTFLEDKDAFNGTKPIDILNKHLTLPLINFWRNKPTSQAFMDNFVEKLKFVALPPKEDEEEKFIPPKQNTEPSSSLSLQK